MTEKENVDPPVHRQRPHFWTQINYSLTGKGLLEEEYTSKVLTHSKILPYEDAWDHYLDRTISANGILLLAAAALACCGWIFFSPPPAWALFPAALLGAAAGVALAWGWKTELTAFDYDGHWIVTFKDISSDPFDAFLDAYLTHVEQCRYPLQRYLETLSLGEEKVARPLRSWTCRFRYDRVVIEERGPWKRFKRRYYSLGMVRSPVRLVWNIPWFLIGATALGLAAASVARFSPHLLPWANWKLALLFSALSMAGVTASLGVEVRIPIGDGSIDSPAFSWYRRSDCKRLLCWFSRLANLADRLEDLRSEDYWEYHRKKIAILKEQGFLDDWPYRSALGRINIQEREEMGGD